MSDGADVNKIVGTNCSRRRQKEGATQDRRGRRTEVADNTSTGFMSLLQLVTRSREGLLLTRILEGEVRKGNHKIVEGEEAGKRKEAGSGGRTSLKTVHQVVQRCDQGAGRRSEESERPAVGSRRLLG
jgi:hypothetical protein